jgi:predicted DNA binding CopG/RHH family protein
MAKIPKFHSDKEAAEFWDTHCLADYEEDLEPADDVVFVRPERQVISLRLDRKIVKKLKTFAIKKGIGYSPLLRMWILERFYKEFHHKKSH